MNKDKYNKQVARALVLTFTPVLERLNKVPTKHLSPALQRVKRRLQEVKR